MARWEPPKSRACLHDKCTECTGCGCDCHGIPMPKGFRRLVEAHADATERKPR